MSDHRTFQVRPTMDPRTFRVFAGRFPIGCVIKEPGGWRPDVGVATDVRRTKEEAARRLMQLKGYGHVDR